MLGDNDLSGTPTDNATDASIAPMLVNLKTLVANLHAAGVQSVGLVWQPPPVGCCFLFRLLPFAGVWLLPFAGVWLLPFAGVWFIPFAGVWFIPFAGVWFLPFAGVWFLPFAGVWFLPFAGVWLLPFAGVWLLPFAGVCFLPFAGVCFLPVALDLFVLSCSRSFSGGFPSYAWPSACVHASVMIVQPHVTMQSPPR
jgi:hypothetical protein